MVKLKGELLWVQQMATTREDPVISVSTTIRTYILLDIYDISLIIEKIFLFGHGPTSYHFPLKEIPTIYKYHRSLMGLPYRSMNRCSFIELII